MKILYVFSSQLAADFWFHNRVILANDRVMTTFGKSRMPTIVSAAATLTSVVITEVAHVHSKIRGQSYDMIVMDDSFGRDMYRLGYEEEASRVVQQLKAYCR